MELSLHIDDLVFAYGRRWLFEGWTARAGAGVTWVQGANGSGKSTLLRLLAGALAPRHGTFELAGQRHAAGDRAAPLAWRQQTFWCLSDPPPTPWLLTCVRTSNREAHVALWALSTGLLTAFGSELWN